jgi:ribosomal protein L11 methyltransferase
MRYHVIHLQTRFEDDWEYDVFDQHMGELGVDTIQANGEPINGYRSDYYIKTERWEENQQKIEAFIRGKRGARLLGVEACPDRNWNESWEAEHPVQELPLGIRIVPHCAFGAGHHETTSMLINSLVASNLTDKIVLDHGTGTGVLAIFAKHLGAKQVIAVDIDEKSVENAKENAELNGEIIEVLHTSSFDFRPSTYDLILANIHRNILIENMPAYAQALKEGGELWLSGFYESDCPMLRHAAEQQGLTLIDVLANGEWRLMRCRK